MDAEEISAWGLRNICTIYAIMFIISFVSHEV